LPPGGFLPGGFFAPVAADFVRTSPTNPQLKSDAGGRDLGAFKQTKF
jgi:hypothetical protein